jgi:hypothetical protein
MDSGNYIPILLGIAFYIIGLALYRARAGSDRRLFRMTAYIQMLMLVFFGTMLIVMGII